MDIQNIIAQPTELTSQNGGGVRSVAPTAAVISDRSNLQNQGLQTQRPQNEAVQGQSRILAFEPESPLDERSLDSQIEETISRLIGEDFNMARLRIDQDEETGRVVFQSVNRETGEVISQFPPETVLRLISSIREAEGIVLDATV
ncbi:flagellar protein FlaG [Iodidimonas nitroreducens]|uniref:flagellar protein FlaG n=1 Tax=Iodidimonas nitroreducens TaxID=1236968 RepID=UPI0013787B31|nr:flagellar protein FlaG [Iodidimonas nitroreducens]